MLSLITFLFILVVGATGKIKCTSGWIILSILLQDGHSPHESLLDLWLQFKNDIKAKAKDRFGEPSNPKNNWAWATWFLLNALIKKNNYSN